ncbi:MAG TPA: hypothetical protein VFS53_03990 [Gemmatimonadota bacterium]|nr:hypothetical protein [Gemmatimonadota bacterium]
MTGKEVFQRLRQTRAARIVGVYAATAWGTFEIVDKTVRTFGWPEAIPRTFLILLIVGLGFVTLAAWAYAGQEIGERTGWGWPARVQAVLTRRWFGRVAVAALGAAVLLWAWRWIQPDVEYTPVSVPDLVAASIAPRVVVLPVTSDEAGLDLERRTLTRLLTGDLNDIGDFRTILGDRVAREWREDPPVEPRVAARFGRKIGAHFVVIGTLERGGEGLRAAAEVIESGRGESKGHIVVEGRAANLPDVSDRLAMEVFRTLVADVGDAGVTSPNRARTPSMHAYKAFLRGERAFRRADFAGAIAEYARATEADSMFAMARLREGLARRWEDPSVGPPLESFDIAMAFGDRLAEDDREMLRASGALEWGMLESVSAMAAVLARRPEDSQAWYMLADAEAWVGPSLLLSPDSVESTLAHAIAADPGFVPTYLIRIPISLLRGADRPALDALVDSIAAADAHPAVVASQRLLVELAFGDGDQSAALQELPVHLLWWLADALGTPRLLDRQAVVLREIRQRADRADPRPAKRVLYYNLLARGLHSDALALLDDPAMSGFLPEASYRSIQRGIGLPADLVLAATNVYDTYGTATTWFYGGAMAADQGRWGDVTYAVDRLFEEARMIEQDGDGYGAREHSVAGGILDQYARVRSNPAPTPERVAELEARRLQGVGSSEWARMVDATARWWLAELWLELGDTDRAAVYFRSLWRDPAAADRLGELLARGASERPAAAGL